MRCNENILYNKGNQEFDLQFERTETYYTIKEIKSLIYNLNFKL